jgi:hypothetical protein
LGEWNGYDAKMKHLLETRLPDDISKQIALGRFDTGPADHWETCREHRMLGVPSSRSIGMGSVRPKVEIADHRI